MRTSSLLSKGKRKLVLRRIFVICLIFSLTCVYSTFAQALSVGDFVWDDTNRNGIQEFDEPGLNGWQVKLYNAQSVLIATTTTAAGGFYSFMVEPESAYYLQFVLEPGWTFTFQHQGTDDTRDSDVDSSGRTQMFILRINDDPNFDAGAYGGTVPEPATMLLLGSGLIGLAGYGRKKLFKNKY